ncbi:hypothetical protein FMEAI12_6790003 [Parafrankia sp. Ea1.12]|nr:hypothetical protein FMEAI12_6790003 [Parafrankia sp. Ea1.12]
MSPFTFLDTNCRRVNESWNVRINVHIDEAQARLRSTKFIVLRNAHRISVIPEGSNLSLLGYIKTMASEGCSSKKSPKQPSGE